MSVVNWVCSSCNSVLSTNDSDRIIGLLYCTQHMVNCSDILVFIINSHLYILHRVLIMLCCCNCDLTVTARLAGPFPHVDELGVSQTSGGKSQPVILIVNISVCVFQMNISVSVTEFSEVLHPFFPPPTFSSVWVGGVVVVVGGCGGTVSGT